MNDPRQENEATLFAMYLLMPAKNLLQDVNRHGGIDLHDSVGIRKLANKYRVDPYVMAARLGQLMVE